MTDLERLALAGGVTAARRRRRSKRTIAALLYVFAAGLGAWIALAEFLS